MNTTGFLKPVWCWTAVYWTTVTAWRVTSGWIQPAAGTLPGETLGIYGWAVITAIETIVFQLLVLLPTFLTRTRSPDNLTRQRLTLIITGLAFTVLPIATLHAPITIDTARGPAFILLILLISLRHTQPPTTQPRTTNSATKPQPE